MPPEARSLFILKVDVYVQILNISPGTWKWLHRENVRPITAATPRDRSSSAQTHGRKPDEGDRTVTVVSKSLSHGGDESVQIATRWDVHHRTPGTGSSIASSVSYVRADGTGG